MDPICVCVLGSVFNDLFERQTLCTTLNIVSVNSTSIIKALVMDALFAQESEKRQGDDLIQFLLDAAPIYGQSMQSSNPVEQDAMIQDFRQKFQRPLQSPPFHCSPRQEVTPYACGFCQCNVVVVDTHNACLVCTNCGISGPIGYEHNFVDPGYTTRTIPYVYEPSKHLLKHLRWIQGLETPRIEARVLAAIKNDLIVRRDLFIHNITPFDVYQSLQRLNLQVLYRHRWAITRMLNTTYVPLNLSHALVEQILAIFNCYDKRFQDGIRSGMIRRKRNFYPYPLFVQCVFKHLRVPNIDHHFKPVKKRRNHRNQLKEINSLFEPMPALEV